MAWAAAAASTINRNLRRTTGEGMGTRAARKVAGGSEGGGLVKKGVGALQEGGGSLAQRAVGSVGEGGGSLAQRGIGALKEGGTMLGNLAGAGDGRLLQGADGALGMVGDGLSGIDAISKFSSEDAGHMAMDQIEGSGASSRERSKAAEEERIRKKLEEEEEEAARIAASK